MKNHLERGGRAGLGGIAYLRGARGFGRLSGIMPDNEYSTPFADSREVLDALAYASQARPQPAPGQPLAPIQAPELVQGDVRLPPFTQPAATPVRDELRYGKTINIPLAINAVSVRVLLAPQPNTRRTFLFIVNTAPVNLLFVNFGDVASALNGIQLNANGGAVGFDAYVPQDDVYIIANGAATPGVLTYSNKGVNDYPSIA